MLLRWALGSSCRSSRLWTRIVHLRLQQAHPLWGRRDLGVTQASRGRKGRGDGKALAFKVPRELWVLQAIQVRRATQAIQVPQETQVLQETQETQVPQETRARRETQVRQETQARRETQETQVLQETRARQETQVRQETRAPRAALRP